MDWQRRPRDLAFHLADVFWELVVEGVVVPGKDAEQLGLKNGDLARVNTEIGYFVIRAWATEGIRPGAVGCSHHLGRWRTQKDEGTDRWASAFVDLAELGDGRWRLRQIEGIKPFKSDDPDSERIFWQEGGVHQNFTFPVHPIR